MTKKDIRKGTYITIAVSIAAFAFIAVIASIGIKKMDTGQKAVAEADIKWSDTISNKASDTPELHSMDTDIQHFMNKWEIKGMSIAVSRNDSLLYAKGIGWADREAGKKMEANSIMRIASASKLITAAAIMKLVEEGKLSLDSKVFGEGGILDTPQLREATRDQRINDITVAHLLRHQGGFTLGAGDPMFNTKDIMEAKHLTEVPDNHKLTEIVLGRKLGFYPGKGRRYSNFGYMLLSLIVEKVTGKSYWDYVHDALLSPAGCDGFRPATNYYEERHPMEVKYYPPDDEEIEEFNHSGRMVTRAYGGANINGLMGAGGWVASAADLCRFVASIDNYPVMKNILRPETIDSMTRYSEKEKLSLGWADTDSTGKWTRTGTLASAHTLIERFPDGECWVLTTNSGVWTGPKFSKDMMRLVEKLRAKYSDRFPKRNLFK